MEVQDHGNCLVCGMEIEYGLPCRYHLLQGDKWLESLIQEWQNPAIITSTGKQVSYNGFAISNVQPYVCLSCRDALKESGNKTKGEASRQKHEQQLREAAERKARYAKLYPKPEPKPTRHDTPEELLALPYPEYLESDYWQAVRLLVKATRDPVCAKCGKSTWLDIHHLTYEFRAHEHEHLDTLQILCRLCHSEAHNISSEV